LPEWIIERGIGETRSALVADGEIIEARIAIEGVVPAGSVLRAKLTEIGTGGRNAVAVTEDGIGFLLPRGASRITQGATVKIEVTREAIPDSEPWKRPLARISDDEPRAAAPVSGRQLSFPAPRDELADLGWNDLMDEARTGLVSFVGGELRISPTPAMTLIDVDGYLPPNELAVIGAREAARAIRRLDIGGSVGVDLPTTGSKAVRQEAAAAIDAVLAQPFERTAINGFGFVQVVRPRQRASLVEIALDRAAFEARALLRRAAFEPAGPKRIVAHPAVVSLLETRGAWTEDLARQVGGAVELRADASVPISGGYAEVL
jgi:ribonuclease G